MMKHMVQRSLSFMVLAAGLLSCTGDPTESLRNGVDQLVADPSEIILDSAATQTVLVQAFDEQGNAVQARFSVTAAAGITVTFDSSFNRVFDANGNLKPQNPATRVRYIVEGDVVGASSFTVTGGGKSTTVSVRVPPPTIPATISDLTPAPGDTLTITLPAPATFVFDPADTNSVATTIGGLTCKVLTVNVARTSLTCVPLPGSNGPVALKNVLPGFGGLGPISVNTSTSVALPLPTLTFTPANPAAGDTVRVIAPAPYKLGTAGTDSSLIVISGATFRRTVRTADSIKFLIGPGVNSPLSITRFRIPGFGGSSNLFTLAATGNVTTPATPVLVSTQGGAQAVGSVITVTASGRYRFDPAAGATTVTLPSTLTGIPAGATVLSISADSMTMTYAIGPSVDTATAVIGGVRISAAIGLGSFSLNTDKTLFTPVLDQFPATLSTQFPVPDGSVTLTAGAGYTFSTNSDILAPNPDAPGTLRTSIVLSRTANTITFVPVPNSGKYKPIVTNIVAAATPNVRFTLPAAIYLTAAKPGAPAPSLDEASTFTMPGVGITSNINVVSYSIFAAQPECTSQAFGATCRPYKIHLNAPSSYHVTLTQTGGNFDLGVYTLNSARVRVNAGVCDDLGSAPAEDCDIGPLPAGDYWLLIVNFSATNPGSINLDITGQ